MSIMNPQHLSFNRGIFKNLKAVVRNWAIKEVWIYVFTAGVLKPDLKEIGANGVDVPEEYYKVIYDPTGTQKMIALVLPNQKGTKHLED